MPLADPVAVYNAATNDEAHYVRNLLVDSGVEAYVTEDLTTVGLSVGPITEIHTPQVWVDRSQADRAGPFLADYQQRKSEQQQGENETGAPDDSPIAVVCDECGQQSVFPSWLRGKVQTCRYCGAFVDVGESDDLDYGEEDENAAAED